MSLNVTHGTRNTYNRGCRCESCKKAESDYQKPYQRERARQMRAIFRQHQAQMKGEKP